jgi:ATP-binding cassette subfamily B protein RaxB
MSDILDLGIVSRRKVRLIRQTELAECGLACLAMVASFYGLDFDMATLRRRFSPSTRGASLSSLMTIADRLGLTPRPVQVELEHLDALALPAVLHWNLNHYVVIEAVSGKKALIHNPDGRSAWMPFGEVSKYFTGVALELEPSASFEPGDSRTRMRLSGLWTRIRGFKRAFAQTVLLSIVIQAFALVSPYYLQLAIDQALPEMNMGLMTMLALGFGLFSIVNGLAALLRYSVLLSAGASFGYGLSSNVARKLFRLPMDWFGRRHVGDILSRFQSVVPIRQMLAEDAPAVMVDGALASLTLLLMFLYSPLLSAVSTLTLILYAAIRGILFRLQRNAQEEAIIASGREQSTLIESIHGMRALRLSGRETLRHAVWQSRMTEAVNGTVRFQRLANWQTVFHDVLFAVENVFILWLAIGMVIRGGFSVGMVFAYLAYKAQFMSAASSLIDKAAAFKMLGLHLERLSDIALAEEDNSFSSGVDSDWSLTGKIELKAVHFRYGAEDPFVLRGVNLVVWPGESVAITGQSGGGKSTMAQIILGLAEPTQGEVLVDDLPLRTFGHQNYHRQIAAVLQDDTLFAGSIIENISLFDEQPELERVKSAAAAAAIAADIDAMPMGYETLVGNMGSALSGGQRQRILLARALYREPKILVLDEGTSHLDEACEREVSRAIASMGITRLIIAHRRETIASADRVLLLKGGVMEEVGSPADWRSHADGCAANLP